MSTINADIRKHRRWPLLLIAAPAAVAVWSGWVGLGDLCGFGVVHPLPGIWDGLRLNTAITLPVGVESYGAYALTAWLVPGAPDAARRFAKRSAIGALALGCLGQVAYHLLAAAHVASAPWPVTMAVACLPVITLSFAAALTHLLRAGEATDATREATLDAIEEPQVERRKPVLLHLMEKPTGDATGEPSPDANEEPPEATDGTPPGDANDEPEPQAIPVTAGEANPDATEEPSSEPETTTPEPPPARPARLAEDQDAIAARAAYRKSVRIGRPLSDRKLGEQFGRGRTWGANRITEVDGGPKLAKAQGE